MECEATTKFLGVSMDTYVSKIRPLLLWRRFLNNDHSIHPFRDWRLLEANRKTLRRVEGYIKDITGLDEIDLPGKVARLKKNRQEKHRLDDEGYQELQLLKASRRMCNERISKSGSDGAYNEWSAARAEVDEKIVQLRTGVHVVDEEMADKAHATDVAKWTKPRFPNRVPSRAPKQPVVFSSALKTRRVSQPEGKSPNTNYAAQSFFDSHVDAEDNGAQDFEDAEAMFVLPDFQAELHTESQKVDNHSKMPVVSCTVNTVDNQCMMLLDLLKTFEGVIPPEELANPMRELFAVPIVAPTVDTAELRRESQELDKRRKMLQEVKQQLDMLKTFEGIIPPEELANRKRDLFESLPSPVSKAAAAPPCAKKQKLTASSKKVAF